MEKITEDEFLDDPSKYFTQNEWKNLGYYEKVRIQNSYEIYVDMKKSGFIMAKPDFMERTKEQPKVQPEIQTERTKRKCTENSRQSVKRTTRKANNDLNLESTKLKRYPKRNLPTKDYKEEEIIPDDYYVYCDICMNEFVDKCTTHEPIFVPDNPVPLTPKNPNRARETVPQGWLNVSSSKIYNGGEGVWALRKIKMGVRFGPYEGTREDEETNGEYSWQIKRDGKVVCYIDGKDTSKANWMRFVNCARNKTEQNVMAYQYRGKIYYRAIADISPCTELLVFYGPQFARELGIDTKNFNSSPEKPLKDNIFECKNCHLAFSSPIYLENHIGRCGNKKISTTDRKVKKTIRNDSITSNNNNNNECYKCHLCTMIYTIKSFYDRHLLVKHCIYDKNQELHSKNIQDLTKRTDDKSTSNDSGYNDEPNNQDGISKRRYKCSDCHRAFTTPSLLEIHTRIHTGERPYKCQTCQKSFTMAGVLKQHKLTHTGERPHQCDVCYRKFNQKSSLITHKRRHDNVRPFQCSVCKKTFTRTGVLSVHMRVHTGEKPYQCFICQYKCTQVDTLKRHIRIHTGEKPYSCQYCQQSFASSSQLNNHKRRHHSNKES